MANVRAVFSVGSSIAKFLDDHYPPSLKSDYPCKFRLVGSGEVATEDANGLDQVVSIFLHRLTINEQLRSANRLQDKARTASALYVDLHYLVTYWGTSAEAEQIILAWVMQQLEASPILDGSVLSNVAEWGIGEAVQLVPTNLSLEDILRIWDALGPKYRLSLSYVARAVHLDRTVEDLPPVVATRFHLQDEMHP